MKREFRWGTQRLADPDPSLTPEQVRDLYAEIYPELTTAAVEITTSEENGVQIQTFAEAAKKPAATASSGGKQTVNFVKSQGTRG